MRAPLRIVLAAAALLPGLAAVAETPASTTADRIRQSEVRQQVIRSQTGKVAEMLGFLVGEFERNGIGGDDVQILKAIQSVLGGLSDKEMHLVISLLQEARSASDPRAARKSVVDAFGGQKTIVVQLRQVLLEYQRRIALYEISLRLEQLAVRQDGNMKSTVRLAKETDNRKIQDYNDGQKSTVQVQQIEEQSLKEETRLVVSRLESIARESDAMTGDRLKAALLKAKDAQLEPSLASAVEDLTAGNLFRATGNERNARDELRRLSRLVAPPKDAVEALRQALKDLDRAIVQQEKVIEETKGKPKHDEREQMEELEERQADLVDKTDLIREELQAIAPQPAAKLKDATQDMQDARARLAEKNRREAQKGEELALDDMQKARAALQQDLAKAEQAEKGANDPLNTLKDLQKKVEELAKQQDQLKQETAATKKKEDLAAAAPKEAALEEKARDLQQQAAPLAPEASQSLGEAAEQMDKAEQALDQKSPQNPADAQKAALDALNLANQQIGQKINQLEQAQQQLAALEQARKDLANLIQGEQKVEQNTAMAAAQPQGQQPQGQQPQGQQPQGQQPQGQQPQDQQPQSLASQQGDVSNQAQQLQQQMSSASPEAAQSVGEAQKDMNNAKSQLQKPDPKGALPPERAALEDLYKAQATLDSKIEDLQSMLGQSADPSSALADAASKLAQAQQALSQAMSQMSQGTPQGMQQASQSMQQAGQLAGQVASDPAGALPQAAQAAAQEAQQELSQGAAEAGAQESGPAGKSAAAAQQSLAQAQAAVALAQAGMSSQPSESGQPGQQPGQGQQGPGPGQAQGPGKGNENSAKGGTGQRQGNETNVTNDGPRREKDGAATYVGLPARDRAALQQSQGEKYPEEYGTMVEQYMKNLSDQENKKD
jgi:hypothetical protein